MKRLASTHYQLFLISVLALALFSLATPVHASTIEVSAQTTAVLPPAASGASCAPIAPDMVTPFIYDGALHSFEFTISDPSYVALVGTVGDTAIPFQLITRRVNVDGSLRVHVDIETTQIHGSLPLRVTLLSARAGQSACLGVVSINIVNPPAPEGPSPLSQSTPALDTPAITTKPTETDVPTLPSDEQVEETVPAESVSVINSMQNPLRDICASEVSAYRTWLIVLVLFTLLVGGALWAEFPMSLPWARTPERIATIILTMLLAVLAFWYFSVSCRAALWMPLLAFFIAVLGLLAAFWNHPRVTQLLLVQDSKTIKLPPAK